MDKTELVTVLAAHLSGYTDKGRWVMFRCPYHNDNNPSFGVDTQNGGFNCFACGETGTTKALFEYLGIEVEDREVDALSEAEWQGVLRSFDRKAAKKAKWPGRDVEILSPYLEDAPPKYAEYLEKKRDLSTSAVVEFGLGWSPEEPTRVLIPVNSLDGNQVIWIERREIGDRKPKYWRPKGVKKDMALFGLSRCIGSNWIVITEGVFDTLSLAVFGIPSACCFGGFSEYQQNVITKQGFDSVYICFDGDEAGRSKAERARAMLGDCGMYVKRINLPDGKDPGDMPRKIADSLISLF